MSPQIAYFFKRIYGNVIKWWFAIYTPVARRVWPTKAEEEAALAKEAKEEKEETPVDDSFGDEELYTEVEKDNILDELMPEAEFDYSEPSFAPSFEPEKEPAPAPATHVNIDDCNYNSTTGAYSGLYGTGPMDSNTQSMFDEIMGKNKAAHSIDDIIAGNEPDYVDVAEPVTPPADQSAVLDEANAIYERLMREAAEDEAKKQAEIEAAKAAQI